MAIIDLQKLFFVLKVEIKEINLIALPSSARQREKKKPKQKRLLCDFPCEGGEKTSSRLTFDSLRIFPARYGNPK